MTDPTTLPAWSALQEHHRRIAGRHLRELFRDDPRRFERYSLRFEDILVDFSQNRIDDETLPLLTALADEAGLRARMDAMFAGEAINLPSDARCCIPRCAIAQVVRSWSTVPT